MSNSGFELTPHQIRVASSDERWTTWTTAATEAAYTVISVSLAAVTDRASLVQTVAAAFEFPYPASGLDALMDYLSDLEWLDETRGFVVVLARMENVPSSVVTELCSILPVVVDRWRAQNIPFLALLSGAPAVCLQALAVGNERLAAAAEVAWAQPGTGPVEVVDDRS